MKSRGSFIWTSACIFLGLTLPIYRAKLNEPEVKLPYGKVRGKWMTTDNGARIAAFLGIPYAKPPVKHLRFQPPEPAEPWIRTLDGSRDGHACIQYDFFTNAFTGDEDCLFINVYKPQMNKTDILFPVMVYIHGGGFASGTGASSIYGPQRLLDKGIVLVTLNYRLGIFGYLSTGDKEAPGNYGMLDQVAALKWVQQNIVHFQGDPDRVTIFGESAGGASVALHILSPLSAGLFQAAIPESGNALASWAVRINPITYAEQVAERLECPTSNSRQLVKCLLRKPAVDIVVKSTYTDLTTKNTINIGPTIDSIRGELAFLPDSPHKLFSEGKMTSNVPILSGVTKDEGAFFALSFASLMDSTQEHLSASVSSLIPYIDDDKILTEKVVNVLTTAHFQGYDDTNITERLTVLINVLSDVFIACAADEFHKLMAANKVQIYVYRFAYKGDIAYTDKFASTFPPITSLDLAGHLDELQYLFRCAYFRSTNLSKKDMRMADVMTTLWTNFAKTLKPSLDGSSSPESVIIRPVTQSLYHYLNIDNEIKMVEESLCRRPEAITKISSLLAAKDEL